LNDDDDDDDDEEATGGWRKFHNKELHNLRSSPNMVIKTRRMCWAGHVARVGEMRNHLNGKDETSWENWAFCRGIILNWIIKK
jgi:hypothetical protein